MKANIRNFNVKDRKQAWNQADLNLSKTLHEKKALIHSHLCDNLDTPKALTELYEIITHTNSYLNNNEEVKEPLLRTIGQYVNHILKCFGVVETGDIGFASGDSVSPEELITPIMNTLS